MPLGHVLVTSKQVADKLAYTKENVNLIEIIDMKMKWIGLRVGPHEIGETTEDKQYLFDLLINPELVSSIKPLTDGESTQISMSNGDVHQVDIKFVTVSRIMCDDGSLVKRIEHPEDILE
jgi:hypothetical protein